MLIVPILQQLDLPAESTNQRLNQILQFLPGTSQLTSVLALFFFLMLTSASINYAQAVVAETLEQGILFDIRSDLYTMLMNAEFQHLMQTHQADYTRILTEESESVNASLDQLFSLTGQLTLIIIYTLLSLYLSPILTGVAVAVGLVLLFSGLPIQQIIARIGQRHLDATESLYRLASDQIKGLKTIKSSGTQDRHIKSFTSTTQTLAQEELRYTKITALTQWVHTLISAFAFCLLIFIAIRCADTDLATLAVLALIFTRLVPQVSRLHVYLQHFVFLGPSLTTVSDLIKTVSKHQERSETPTDFDLTEGIRADKLSYRYPNTSNYILNGFEANLPANSLTVVKGASGIGKSTLADLLAGITLPTSGSIEVAGKPIDATNHQSWRRKVAYLPQSTFIVEATIRDNLNLLLHEPASDEHLIEALKLCAAEFVLTFERGLDTCVGDGGVNLSGGERQRLQLARAMLDPRPILILDEATSNLDRTSELAIAKTLSSLRTNTIVVVMTHRDSFNAVADQIVSIDTMPTSSKRDQTKSPKC